MQHFVRARTLQGFGELVRKLDADPAHILTRAGLDPDVLSRSDDWIPFRSVLVAYQTAAIVTGCESLGIQLSNQRDLGFLGPLVLIFKYSDDLESGLLSITRYLSVHTTGFTPVLQSDASNVSWRIVMPDAYRAHADQWMEESLLTAIKLLRVFLGETYVPMAVAIRHGANAGTEYHRHFGTQIDFLAPFDGLVIARDDLNVRNPVGDREVFQFLMGYLDSRVLRANEDLHGAIRSLLRKLIPTGKFSIGVVADQIGVHQRTLQRRLSAAGLTYAELLDESRAELAREFLTTSNLPMVNLAYMLGYADQSAFNHAFKRWYGTTPRAWRSANQK
ncbi:MAG: AraC family transcriptional regulator [Gammaproteobacteria bacterium]|nr:AraC family transcriptional regulator [Gammaproteobacteria bacterium]